MTKDRTKEIIKKLEKIITKTKEEDKEILIRIIKLILKEKIGNKEVERLVNKIEGGKKEMLALVDMIRKENQMYVNIGRKQTYREIAKKLLNKNISKKEISEITGLDKIEIDEIAKEK